MKKLNLKKSNHLILAGSKVSFSDIQTLQTDLPIHSRKYYLAKDVDDVFILINGVLTDVSEHAFRNDKLLSDNRRLISEKDNTIKELTHEVKELKTQLDEDTLVEQNKLLKEALVKKQQEFDAYKTYVMNTIKK